MHLNQRGKDGRIRTDFEILHLNRLRFSCSLVMHLVLYCYRVNIGQMVA
jgi:hypothetical protein